MASRFSSTAQVPVGQTRPLDDGRVQLAGVADDGVADDHLGATAGMPRQVLGGPQRQLDAGGAADDPDRLERIAGIDRPALTPRTRGFAQAGQHRADVLRLMRQRRIERRDLVCGGASVGRNAFHRAGFRRRLHHLGDREQRGIDGPAGHVAPQRLQQARQQRGRQLGPVGLQRIHHLRRGPPRVVRRQAPLVEDTRGQERRWQDLHIAVERQRLSYRAPALLRRAQAAARRARAAAPTG